MSTHNLCFRAKLEKMYTPVQPSFTIQKWGVRGGVFVTRTCFRDELKSSESLDCVEVTTCS